MAATTHHAEVAAPAVFQDGDYDAMLGTLWELSGARGVRPVAVRRGGLVLTSPSEWSWMVCLIHELAASTRLGGELPRLMAAIDERDGDGAGTYASRSPSHLAAYVTAWARRCPFEPAWHVRLRAASRPLPDVAWNRLRDAYEGRVPAREARREPPEVRAARRSEPGYARMLDAAYAAADARARDAAAEVDVLGGVVEVRHGGPRPRRGEVGMDGLPAGRV